MKKLFCSVVFALGIFVSLQAQMNVSLTNNTTIAWTFRVTEAGGNTLQLTAPAGGLPVTGNMQNAAFNFDYAAFEASNFCQPINGTITALGTGGNLVVCPAASWGRKLTYDLQTVNGILQLNVTIGN
jgi:hypothetical protein